MGADITSPKEVAALLRRVAAALELGDFSECDEVPPSGVALLIEDCDCVAEALYPKDVAAADQLSLPGLLEAAENARALNDEDYEDGGVLEVAENVRRLAEEEPKRPALLKTTIVFEVLHDEPLPDDAHLGEVYRMTVDDHCSGDIKSWETVFVSPMEMRELLKAQRSDPDFFNHNDETS